MWLREYDEKVLEEGMSPRRRGSRARSRLVDMVVVWSGR